MAESLRILFIAPAPRAGTAQYTHNLANALVRRGHQVALATGMGFELKSFARQYALMEVFDRYRPRPLRLARFAWRYLAWRPHVVHLQGAQHPAVYILLWAMLRALHAATFVYTPQDILPNKLRPGHIRALRFLYARMCHVFLNARQNASLLVQTFAVPSERTTVLPLPDLTAFVREELRPEQPDVPKGARVALCFGLIEPRKGIATLIAAAPEVLRHVPDAYILIVGKPLMSIESLEAQIVAAGVGGRVRLIPQYASFAQLVGYFERADLVVLPYESGWNSGVLASAFGFGKPVVATRVGGLDEVVEHDRTGLLVPPGDPAALAEALAALLGNDALRARLGVEVVREARRFSWAQIAQTTEECYAHLVTGDAIGSSGASS